MPMPTPTRNCLSSTHVEREVSSKMQDYNSKWQQPDRTVDPLDSSFHTNRSAAGGLNNSIHTNGSVPKAKRPSTITMKRVLSSKNLLPTDGDGDGDGASKSGGGDGDGMQMTVLPPLLKHKLFFVYDMVAGVDIVVVFALSLAVASAVNHLGPAGVDGKRWFGFLSESKPAIATLGAFYSFALVFRTNICYARWWEGRTLWGALIVNSIRITQQGRVSRYHFLVLLFIMISNLNIITSMTALD